MTLQMAANVPVVSLFEALLLMHVNFNVWRDVPVFPQIIDIGFQSGGHTALTFDKVKLNGLRGRSAKDLQRGFHSNDRGAVLSLFVASGASETVNVDDAIEARAATDDREPRVQVSAEDFEFRGRMSRNVPASRGELI